MPVRRLRKYVEALPALEAQDALDWISRLRAGGGVMDERDQREYVSSLQRAASGGRQRAVKKATVASLSALGIAVETLPAPDEKPKRRPRRKAAKPSE